MRVVISGYYGYGNSGDEAVLQGVLAGLERAAGGRSQIEAVVLSGTPEATAAMHGVEAAPGRSPLAVWRALRRADLLISGGGGLIQDRTSARSSLYYLGVIAMAYAARVPVYVYGQGIGPVRRRWLRRLAGLVLRGVQGAGVRDEVSGRLLTELGVPRERIQVTADAAFALPPPTVEERAQALASVGSLTGQGDEPGRRSKPLVGVVWRSPGTGCRQAVAGAVASFARARLASVVVVPFHPSMDREDARRFAHEVAEAGGEAVLFPDGLASPRQALALVAAMDLAVCVRFHGLVYAAIAGVPALAIAYDPKVSHLAAILGVPCFDPAADPGLLGRALHEVWEQREEVGRRLRGRAAELRARSLAEGQRALAAAARPGDRHRDHESTAARDPQRPRVDILGVGVDCLAAGEAVQRLTSWWEAGASGGNDGPGGWHDRQRCHQVVTLNPEMLMAARRDPELRRILAGSSLVVADGIGVVWASRLLGRPLPERIAGIDLVTAAIGRAAKDGRTLYLLGGEPGIAQKAAERLRQRFPGLRVIGTRHGYFSEAEEGEVIREISEAAPDLLLVGLGTPKQERWIHQHREQLGARVAVGVGGALDVFAGKVQRAPLVWQKLGLEWAYRLIQEPRRYRRMMALPRFVLQVLKEKLRGHGARG